MNEDRADIQRVLDNIAAAKSRVGFLIGVFGGGGVGDLMRTLAFCRAVKRRSPNLAVALLFSHIGEDADGQNLTHNILAGNDCVDVHIPYGLVQWHRAMRSFYDQFPVFFEVQHAVIRSWYWERSRRYSQAGADRLVKAYATLGDHFPRSNADLESTGESCWEIMSKTSGLDVTPDDMQIECGRLPAGLDDQRAVVFNNGFGGLSRLKSIPPSVLSAVANELAEAGFTPVQVGLKGEPVIENTICLRGLTINDSAAVIKAAEMYVGPEGGMAYVAKAVGTPSAVLYGPTPVSAFHMDGNSRWSTFECRACWYSHIKWDCVCKRDAAAEHCVNMKLDGVQVGRELVKMLEQTE